MSRKKYLHPHLFISTCLCLARDNDMLFAVYACKCATAISCDFVAEVRLTNNDIHQSCLSVRRLS
jgi:hypothetical protein